jgi:DmsE family decaheme c-type cytochrome
MSHWRFSLACVAALCSLTVSAEPAQQATSAESHQALDRIFESLPRTDLSSDSRPPIAHVAAPPAGFARAHVATNPRAPDAKRIGEKTCIACHQLEASHFTHTLHALGLHVANRSDPQIPVCEACHGPGSEHAANPQAKGLIIGYTKSSGTPIETQTRTCLTCHAGGPRDHWVNSVHQLNGLSCSDCHNPMSKFSTGGLMAKASINDTCAQCHQDVRQQFNRRSHMPLPEGQMSCDDCHNPHGALTNNGNPLLSGPLLKTNTVNETCYQCHAEKRGPWLWEHPPVRESCLTCHSPHGSNQSSLLVASVPMLCQQCHAANSHAGALQTRQNIGGGANPEAQAMSRGCLSCHANIHGSNAPSGTRFHQ